MIPNQKRLFYTDILWILWAGWDYYVCIRLKPIDHCWQANPGRYRWRVEHSSVSNQLLYSEPIYRCLCFPTRIAWKKHRHITNLGSQLGKGKEETIQYLQNQMNRFRKGGRTSANNSPTLTTNNTFAVLPVPHRTERFGKQLHEDVVRDKIDGKTYYADTCETITHITLYTYRKAWGER